MTRVFLQASTCHTRRCVNEQAVLRSYLIYFGACCSPFPTQIGYLMSETERLALLTKDGPGVHRDLCHGGCHAALRCAV